MNMICVRLEFVNPIGETRTENERWRVQKLDRGTQFKAFRQTYNSNAEISRQTIGTNTCNRIFKESHSRR